MDTKHTPMKQIGTTVRFFGGGFDVRDCPEPEALAATIVRAMNSHDQLVEVVKEMMSLGLHLAYDVYGPEFKQKAVAALAAANA